MCSCSSDCFIQSSVGVLGCFRSRAERGARHGAVERRIAARAPRRAPRVPFGTELTDLELDLVEALTVVGDVREDVSRGQLPAVDFSEVRVVLNPPEEATPYLERMGLAAPTSMQETLMQKLILFGLARVDHL